MRKAEGLFLQRLGVPAPLPESVRPRGALWAVGGCPGCTEPSLPPSAHFSLSVSFRYTKAFYFILVQLPRRLGIGPPGWAWVLGQSAPGAAEDLAPE